MAAVLPEHELWPWTQRSPEGDCVQTPPRVCYRIGPRGPVVYTWGAGARRRIEDLAYHLNCIRLPDGDPVPVRGVVPQVWEDRFGVLRETWRRYEFATPYWPSRVVEARRPRRGLPAWAEHAWASAAITSSIRTLFAAIGIEETPAHPMHVEVDGLPRFSREEWSRPQRKQAETRTCFTCSFVANVELPDGIPLGGKGSEGFGEVRHAR